MITLCSFGGTGSAPLWGVLQWGTAWPFLGYFCPLWWLPPWGNTTSTGAQASANPWQYAGGYKDASTGYTKFGARYYDPTTGRFTQIDPSNQETNRYGYVKCNPVNATDPSGLDESDCWLAALGVLGAAIPVLFAAGSILADAATLGYGALLVPAEADLIYEGVQMAYSLAGEASTCGY